MTTTASPDLIPEVVIIGAGVVGIAVARALAATGQSVLVIEKGTDLLSGASKANSAILHTGFDAPPGTLEAACVARGHQLYLDLMDRHELSLLKTGALVVAWNEDEAARLPVLVEQAIMNGVTDIRVLTAAQTAAREPALANDQQGALWVPREYVIDPWTPFHRYAAEAQIQGAQFRFDCTVTGGRFEGDHWLLQTDQGLVRAQRVVNCAGLFGDRVDAACLGDAGFAIHPRKGQFVVFDKAASALVNAIILPVPTQQTKGVVLTRTAFGNLLVGPTAEETHDRNRATTDRATLQALIATAQRLVPDLAGMPVTATYAGLRPASEEKQYRIRHEPALNWLTIGGIRSTGMTASLGLAEYAVETLLGKRPDHGVPPPLDLPQLSEHAARDWQCPGWDEIVCQCEMVTRREIEAALNGPMPPRSLSGLKRRTRCMMGRCQGFNCAGRLAELTDGRLPHPMPGASPC